MLVEKISSALLRWLHSWPEWPWDVNTEEYTDGLVQVNGGWELGLQSRLGVAWEVSTTIRSVVCLPFSSVDAAPHLF